MDELATQIAETLAILLDEIQRNEAAARDRGRLSARSLPALLPCYTLDELDKAHQRGDFFMADPVGQSLRLGVKKIGHLLASHGYDIEQMREVANKAAGDCSGRITIVDKWWDGVEIKGGSVWAA